VLTKEKNDMLVRVGRGTPMGELLRRYWQPIGGASQLDDNPIKAIRLFGEDLVVYKDLSGRYGLIDRHCPHRRADMSYGWVEEKGVRCSYHGWLVDEQGHTLEQPYEDTTLPRTSAREGCDVHAYPVKECAGMLWAYMGPLPAPELPVWEPFTWDNGFREIVLADVPCNWVQCQENSIDPVHFEWMHDNWSMRMRGAMANDAPKHLKLKFEAFDHGFTYKRVREGQSLEDRYWTVGRMASSSAAILNGACRSTMRTRCRSAGSSCGCRRDASPTCRTKCRAGSARSRTTTAAGFRAMSSTRTSSPGSGRARSPTAPRRTCGRATPASR
jgi:5,5'-dehydrodivanillate O-demethylase